MILILELREDIVDVRQAQPVLAALLRDGSDPLVSRLYVADDEKEEAVLEVVGG